MEVMKCIIGYENYTISRYGKVTRDEKELSCWNYKDYISVALCKNGTKKNFYVHRLVAQAFIPNPDNKPQVNHKNGIKDDNRVENLEWNTRSENQIHSRNILNNKVAFQINHPDKGKFGINNRHSKKVDQYTKDGILIKTWDSMMDIQRELGIKQGIISDVCRGRNKTCRQFIWKFN